jgi:hypothetical protein
LWPGSKLTVLIKREIISSDFPLSNFVPVFDPGTLFKYQKRRCTWKSFEREGLRTDGRAPALALRGQQYVHMKVDPTHSKF